MLLKNIDNLKQWFRWTLVCGIGELVGLAVASMIEWVLWATFGTSLFLLHGLLFLAVAIGAGYLEGWLSGFCQWIVLQERFPSISLKPWVRASGFGAAIAWFLGSLPSIAFASLPGFKFPPIMLVFTAILAGMILGGIIGLFQWRVLKNHSPHSGLWIIGNVLAWPIGTLIIYIVARTASSSSAPMLIFGLGAFSGLASGLAIGGITGLFFIALKPTGSKIK